jgi:hypothetical protein
MLNEMLELRAPENKRTGMEINPNVKYPDQTEDAIESSPQSLASAIRRHEFNRSTKRWMQVPDEGNPTAKHDTMCLRRMHPYIQ